MRQWNLWRIFAAVCLLGAIASVILTVWRGSIGYLLLALFLAFIAALADGRLK